MRMEENMELAVISFTPRGTAVCRRLVEKLADLGHLCTGYIPESYARETEKDTGIRTPEKDAGKPGQIRIRKEPLAVWTEGMFPLVDGFVFVGAAGIAVRAVAPWVRDKMTDPAVVVVDEGGQFAVSLLSGHLGGANALARQVAKAIGAQPVITTASDVEGVCGVDLWARDHGLVITDRVQARKVQMAVLEGNPVTVFWDPWLEACLPWLGREELPQGWTWSPEAISQSGEEFEKCPGRQKVRIGITLRSEKEKAQKNPVLWLVPQILTVGVGCRRGVAGERIRERVQQVLEEAGLDPGAVCRIASIDRKKEEPGILALARHWQVPYETFPAARLETVEQPVEESEFVRSVTGTGNVCERAALLAAGQCSRLVVKKQAGEGITVAVAAGRRSEK